MTNAAHRSALACSALLLMSLLLGGCATTAPGGTRNAQDPYERLNRATYQFNDVLDRASLKPAARGYEKITPRWLRTGIGNFFTNLGTPATAINQLLQGKPGKAAQDTGRFLLNTLFGLGGLLDAATPAGLPRNDEDFGQTLGVWGVPAGPYVMLPLFGPSTLRDAPSRIADYFLGPLRYVDLRWQEEWGLRAINVVDDRAQLLSLEPTLQRAYDRYSFIRNAWLQRREYQVRDGDVPDEEPLEEFPDENSPGDTPAPASPPAP